MKKLIYIETSIPSAYFDIRKNHISIARKEWTRICWNSSRENNLFVTSEAVIDELSMGSYPIKDETLNLVSNLPLLEIDQSIQEIVEAYIKYLIMPANPVGDALHLAIASYYKCEFLLTWNCKHLANANKFDHIRRVNMLLGLYNPYLITPIELINLEDI